MKFARTEQEEKLDVLFQEIEAGFKKVEKAKDPNKVQTLLKELTNKLKDAKSLVKEFEREARIEGMPPRELADRKRALVSELNNYIATKKTYSSNEAARDELLGGGGGGGAAPSIAAELGNDGKSVQQLVVEGKKQIQESDAALGRSEKLVEDTMQIGQQTAATLHDQTQQLNKIVDDLNEIEFTMKKASKVLRDIGKGIMTDRCIAFLLFLVVCGVIALVVVKVINPNKKAIGETVSAITPNITLINATDVLHTAVDKVTGLVANGGGSSRRLLHTAAGGWRHGGNTSAQLLR